LLGIRNPIWISYYHITIDDDTQYKVPPEVTTR